MIDALVIEHDLALSSQDAHFEALPQLTWPENGAPLADQGIQIVSPGST